MMVEAATIEKPIYRQSRNPVALTTAVNITVTIDPTIEPKET
jgi:hypothetical protein